MQQLLLSYTREPEAQFSLCIFLFHPPSFLSFLSVWSASTGITVTFHCWCGWLNAGATPADSVPSFWMPTFSGSICALACLFFSSVSKMTENTGKEAILWLMLVKMKTRQGLQHPKFTYVTGKNGHVQHQCVRRNKHGLVYEKWTASLPDKVAFSFTVARVQAPTHTQSQWDWKTELQALKSEEAATKNLHWGCLKIFTHDYVWTIWRVSMLTTGNF